MGCSQRQRGCRALQRPPLADGRLHTLGREPDRSAHGDELHGLRPRCGHLLLPSDRGGCGRERQQCVGAVDGRRSCPDCRPRRGLRVQRRLGLDRRRLVGRRQHGVAVRRHLECRRPVRLGAQLRRRQRLGDHTGRELARPDDCDDARGVGPPLGAWWLADGDGEGTDGRSRLRALRRPGGRAPARAGVHRLGAERGRDARRCH